jgi:membrane protein required for colicin V production
MRNMLQSLNFVDYIILAILLLSIILGFVHGFIRSILSVCVWIAAFFISAYYGPHLATTFSLVTANPQWQLWLSYGTVFIAAVVIGFVIRLILNLILTGGEVGILNRFCGGLFGFARGILIILLFVWFAVLVNMNQADALKNSELIPFFNSALTSVEAWFPALNATAQSAVNAMNTNAEIQLTAPITVPLTTNTSAN